MSPHAQRETGACHNDKTVEGRGEEREGGGEGEMEAFLVLENLLAWLGLCSKDIKYSLSTWNPGACVHNDTTGHGATLVLFVVDSKLAFNYI